MLRFRCNHANNFTAMQKGDVSGSRVEVCGQSETDEAKRERNKQVEEEGKKKKRKGNSSFAQEGAAIGNTNA